MGLEILNEGFLNKYVKPRVKVNEAVDEKFKLRFYKIGGNSEGELDHEEFFADKNDAINKYKEVFKRELFSLNPTLWEKQGNDWKKISPYTNESLNEEKVEGEIFHNDNGKSYDVLERNSKGDAFLKQVGIDNYIVAFNCPKNKGSWGQGHYFGPDYDGAKALWDEKYLDEACSKKNDEDEKEELNEDADISEYQKWVDYDMKKYNRISDNTMKQIKDAGFSVVRDQYGDYEVIADRKDECYKNESLKEDLDKSDYNDFVDDLMNKIANTVARHGNGYKKLSKKQIQSALQWCKDNIFDEFDNYWFDESLKEDLDKSDYLTFTDEVVQAVLDVVSQYRDKLRKNVSAQDIKNAVAYCNSFIADEADYWFDESLKTKLNSLLKQLHEKEMSDEDKHDNEILKRIYTKINGKKVGKNTFTPEEQEILKKYGLDSWGYRGQTKMVTDAGRKDVVRDDETKSSWRKPAKFNKINYADRARKIDDRDYAQNINHRKYWNQSFDDAEKEFQNKQLTKNVDNMKSLLKSRKYHQDQIDNSDKNLQKRLDDIEQTYQKDLQAANDDVEWKRSYYGKNILDAQDRIDKLLDKHRVKECLKKLSEAMSPEDEADTEILRTIYNKILNRSNARLTPEEQAVIDKYNLKRADKNLIDSDYNALFSGEHNSKVNYADKARKLSDRNYAKDIKQNYRYRGKTFQDKEQDKINKDISADVDAMKSALYDRKLAKANFDDAERNYRFKKSNAEVNKQNRINREKRSKDDQLNYHKNSLDKVNSEIKSMLKKESLNEDAANKVRIKTGLTGDKNNEILESVIGQMSDGIWENSPGMTGYWYPVNIDGTDIMVDNVMDFKQGDKYVTNKYYHMSEAEVKRFFANKIKQIAQEWLNDNNLNPYKNWNAECDEICTYLDRGSDVTIADAYNAYKTLK